MMRTFSIRCWTIFFLVWGPLIFAFCGPWMLPIVLAFWYGAYRMLRKLIADLEKEKRRSAGQAERRSRVCVRRTRPYYNREI